MVLWLLFYSFIYLLLACLFDSCHVVMVLVIENHPPPPKINSKNSILVLKSSGMNKDLLICVGVLYQDRILCKQLENVITCRLFDILVVFSNVSLFCYGCCKFVLPLM